MRDEWKKVCWRKKEQNIDFVLVLLEFLIIERDSVASCIFQTGKCGVIGYKSVMTFEILLRNPKVKFSLVWG